MATYLLDTNHATMIWAEAEPMTTRFHRSRASGDQFGLSLTVLGELYFAVHASRRRDENLLRLKSLRAATLLWPFTEVVAEEFGRIRAEQKAKGRPIPPVDAQIAAVARLHQLTLLTADHHFQFVDGIMTENWLAS